MDKPQLYPLQFVPQIKEKVWGGNQLVLKLNKTGQGPIGESWELSGIEASISIVENGPLQGAFLTDLINEYKELLVGARVYKKFGNQFPLLFKFIDAQQDLSVQVHPDDILAKERHDAFGKTEMWYILEAESEARLILGFNRPLKKEQFEVLLDSGKITEVLKSVAVAREEVFYITPGTVHAIGAGVLLAEIQQTSDITYRIYDWDRPDTDGKLRQLHTEEALDAIKFDSGTGKVNYKERSNERVLLKQSAYFTTNKLALTRNYFCDSFQPESFKVYMCVAGQATLTVADTKIDLQKGQTILIPACCAQYEFKTEKATLLEVYIP